MGLAPPVVIVRPYQEQSKDKRLVCCLSIDRVHHQQSAQNKCDQKEFFPHGLFPPVVSSYPLFVIGYPFTVVR
jgi:hypothetical protein